MKHLAKNFPWLPFVVAVVLCVLSHLFKAYDMAAVSLIGILGSFVVFFYNCHLDRQYNRDCSKKERES